MGKKEKKTGDDDEEELNKKKPPINEVIISEFKDSDDSTGPGTSSEEEKAEKPRPELPPEYWHVQKLMKYIKCGNPTATVMALCCLKDHDLKSEINQMAIQDISGLEILTNLLECSSLQCKIGTLIVLIQLAEENHDIRRCIVNYGGAHSLVANLSDPARDLKIYTAELLHQIGKVRRARKQVRKDGGIEQLVDLIDCPVELLHKTRDHLTLDENIQIDLVRAGSRALWSISNSRKNIKELIIKGAIPLLARTLRCVHMDVILPITGVISNCSQNPNFRVALYTENMVPDIVSYLNNDDPLMRRHCAEAIFKGAEDEITRNMVREAGGLEPLVKMAGDHTCRKDKLLTSAVTGAIWKCAISMANVVRLNQLGCVTTLTGLLSNVEEDERVLSNAVGALHELLKDPDNRRVLRGAYGIPYLVNLLNYTYPPLLRNVPLVLRESAEDDESMRLLEQYDGVRLLWSLLKNPDEQVQANAAWSLVPNIRNAYDSGEMIRCFVGGLELIVNRLKSQNPHVLACVCAAIAEIAKDIENLAIITDQGVVPMLVNLVETTDVELREHLSSAIAYCCAWGSNCKQFGRLGAITPLVGYMAENNINVHRTTALALYYLSKNPFNCVTMHESGVVKYLLKATASTDRDLQEAAAGCLQNIRKLALDAETIHLVRKGPEEEEEEEEPAPAAAAQ